MPLVPAKCPNCGGNLNVDQAQAAAICEYCKQPFVVEQAINNFNTTYNITNTNNITAEHVTVIENKESEENTVRRIEIFTGEKDYPKAVEYLEKLKDLNIGNSEIPRLKDLIISSMEGEISRGLENWDEDCVRTVSEQLLSFSKENTLASSAISKLPAFRAAVGSSDILDSGISMIDRALSNPAENCDSLEFDKIVKAYCALKNYDSSLSSVYERKLGDIFKRVDMLLSFTDPGTPQGTHLSYSISECSGRAGINTGLIERFFIGFKSKFSMRLAGIPELDAIAGKWHAINDYVQQYNTGFQRQGGIRIHFYGRFAAGVQIRALDRNIENFEDLIDYVLGFCQERRLCPYCFQPIGFTGKCGAYNKRKRQFRGRACSNSAAEIRIGMPGGAINRNAYINFEALAADYV